MTDRLPFLDLTAPGFSTRGAAVRAARAAAWCARTPMGLAVLRHREAGQLLRDRRLRQGSHAWPDAMGLTGSFARFWKASVIAQEGAAHRAQRRAVLAALDPDWVAGLAPRFAATATALARTLPQPCEFVHDFSEPFAGRAIATLLGLPDADAAGLAQDAARLGLAMGLDAKSHEQVFNSATDRLSDLARRLIARARATGSTTDFTGRLVAAAGELDTPTLVDLVVIAIFGGVDTTRAQLAFAMALFAEHPDQWDRLRNDPGLVPQALEEVIRARPTTTWATREAVTDFRFGGVAIAAGETLHILVHASGTDPLAVPDWQFDIAAPRRTHFGFGGGAHHCLGQFVARTDMAAALRVLAGRFRSVEFAGTPDWQPDSGNTSPNALPLRFSR